MAHINALLLRTGIALIIGVVASQQKTSQLHEFRRKVLVLLHELCHLPEAVDVKAVRTAIIEEFSNEFEIVFLNNKDMCTNNLLVRTILMKEMEDEQTVAIIGSTEPFLCDTISKFTDANKKLFVSWNCPQVGKDNVHYPVQPYTVRLLPPVRDVVGAMLSLFKHFRWKRAAIVTVEKGAWWYRVGLELEYTLSNENISSTTSNSNNNNNNNNAFIVLPATSTQPFIEHQMRQIMTAFKSPDAASKTNPYEDVIVLCISEYSRTYATVVRVLSKLQPIVPIIVMRLSSNFYDYHADVTTRRAPIGSFDAASPADYDYVRGSCANETAERQPEDDGGAAANTTDESLKYQFLFLSPYAQKHHPEDWFRTLLTTSAAIVRGGKPLENGSSAFNVTRETALETRFLLSDIVNSSASLRQILTLFKNESAPCIPAIADLYSVEALSEPPIGPEWFQSKLNMKNNNRKYDSSSECFMCGGSNSEISMELISLGLLILLVVIVFLCGITFLIRRQYVNRRRLKDPCKILLTSEDIVFPQLYESKKVQERIGAVLCCCYIREPSEFDGAEVDKPDLLKGRDDSVKSFPLKNVTSCTSVSKPISTTEIKARYNGDLVQLKDIPVQGGAFELRSKSLNVLMMIHGLRHENLNPLIGLMADPVRPALVWEYCSRGSLEDVLMQDEIKLDWSFRLSLLTDLVRGMKYLHSYPYRVHGSLTSRNCVIDARWVLKITDYSLAEFYNSQGIADTHLLWTAPELLRDRSLSRRGTQHGDIYSFAIIMQEVVVRGEPFCMLALKPDDIIEKLKTPPPLIRPSVSKGAAPPEAINIMRQCWAEQPEKRPDFNAIYDLFKTLNHGRKINFVDTMFQMLEKYSNNLEDLIRERTEQLDMEKKKTEQLLNRMLPYSVAEKLKLGMHVDPEEFSEVTIYFSDIVGFTTISAYSTPFEVVDLLNDLYTCFDDTINAYNVYKVETIGDAYMVVGGIPVCIPDHADQIATMALDLLHQSGQFKIRHLPSTPLRLRIGLHTGSCCAGVVGLTMPRYCLFGDTVNTASRLESTGSPGRIHISEATKLKLDLVGAYKLEYRGETELKGKGKMPTYWLLGKEGFDKDIPEPPPITENHGLDEELIRKCSRRYGHGALTKHPSESSVEQEPVPTTSTHSRQLVLQKSLDSGLPGDACPTRTQKNWMNRRQMTFDLSDQRTYKHMSGFDQGKMMQLIPETAANGRVPHSDASTPHSTSDKSIDLVGVSVMGSKSGSVRQRKYADAENDLSKPYNYYRCLPPADTADNQAGCSSSSTSSSSKFVSKFLKRQFSVDKADDAAIVLQELSMVKSANVGHHRLAKQNSTGGNHEAAVADKTDKSQIYKLNNNNNNVPAAHSVSNESLS